MLAIRDLVKVYPGPVAALQAVDIDVPRGMFGLLGSNGAGKTTLMRILAGLLEPTSGTVVLDGEDLTGRPERVWPQLGYLPQDFGFFPHLSGERMLAYLLRLKGVRAPRGIKKLCAVLLDRVNLTFAAKRKVKGYTGGMRQRLGIAQAIAGDPRLLIVDDPRRGRVGRGRDPFRVRARPARGRSRRQGLDAQEESRPRQVLTWVPRMSIEASSNRGVWRLLTIYPRPASSTRDSTASSSARPLRFLKRMTPLESRT
jgi:ABC-type lipoprotein export system ATPase subunit